MVVLKRAYPGVMGLVIGNTEENTPYSDNSYEKGFDGYFYT
jgi:hypothetical protein